MCIACELGYLAMVDALEAERTTKGDIPRLSDAGFTCDALPESTKPGPGDTATDEPTP